MKTKAESTIIIRHRKENKKKCSLEPIKERKDCTFYTYPLKGPLDYEEGILLSFEGPEISVEDRGRPLIIIDATWKKAKVMEKEIFKGKKILKRSLPKGFKTAYPRRQLDCDKPEEGLASIEALYIAYLALRKEDLSLLDDYYWKDSFLDKNKDLIKPFLS